MDAYTIKKRREELGLTQNDIAEYMGCSRNTIYRWETGKQNPSYEDLQKLSSLLKYGTNNDEEIKSNEISEKSISMAVLEIDTLSSIVNSISRDVSDTKNRFKRLKYEIFIAAVFALLIFMSMLFTYEQMRKAYLRYTNNPIIIEYFE